MEAEEFDDFYSASFARLTGQLYAMIGNRDEAQECVQEAFVRAWTGMPVFGDVGPALRISCSLKSIARFVGLAPIEVDRTKIHDLSNEALHAYASSDARLARVLTERRMHRTRIGVLALACAANIGSAATLMSAS